MSNNEHEVMADKQRAERIKKVILEHSTYEELAEKTGISVSTLVRIASGKTEPKLSDIIQIAKITGADLNTLAYGYALDVKEEATERKLITSADGCTDVETTNAHNFIVWNIRTLDKQDILAYWWHRRNSYYW